MSEESVDGASRLFRFRRPFLMPPFEALHAENDRREIEFPFGSHYLRLASLANDTIAASRYLAVEGEKLGTQADAERMCREVTDALHIAAFRTGIAIQMGGHEHHFSGSERQHAVTRQPKEIAGEFVDLAPKVESYDLNPPLIASAVQASDAQATFLGGTQLATFLAELAKAGGHELARELRWALPLFTAHAFYDDLAPRMVLLWAVLEGATGQENPQGMKKIVKKHLGGTAGERVDLFKKRRHRIAHGPEGYHGRNEQLGPLAHGEYADARKLVADLLTAMLDR